MIMGFVCCTRYWDAGFGPLGISDQTTLELNPLQICCFDNRGSGKSGSTIGAYEIKDLAKDAIVLLEHLGWIRFVNEFLFVLSKLTVDIHRRQAPELSKTFRPQTRLHIGKS